MLYVNVYHERQAYGGPEEGGWYYQIGNPVASVPVDSDYKPGKSYYIQHEDEKVNQTKAGIHIRDCYTCSGTGKTMIDPEDGSECYEGRCEDCGLVPEKPEEAWKLIQKYQDFFKDTPGRHERIVVMLQEGFATSYPDKRPHYE